MVDLTVSSVAQHTLYLNGLFSQRNFEEVVNHSFNLYTSSSYQILFAVHIPPFVGIMDLSEFSEDTNSLRINTDLCPANSGSGSSGVLRN